MFVDKSHFIAKSIIEKLLSCVGARLLGDWMHIIGHRIKWDHFLQILTIAIDFVSDENCSWKWIFKCDQLRSQD